MNQPEVSQEVEQFVRKQFAVSAGDPSFGTQTDLFDGGYVDSVGLAEMLVQAAELTAKAMPNLRNMRTKAGNLHEYVTRIDALEDEGDRLYGRTTAYLYGGDFKAMDVLRYEDIVKSIEGAIDRLEDVANTIETITTKSA